MGAFSEALEQGIEQGGKAAAEAAAKQAAEAAGRGAFGDLASIGARDAGQALHIGATGVLESGGKAAAKETIAQRLSRLMAGRIGAGAKNEVGEAAGSLADKEAAKAADVAAKAALKAEGKAEAAALKKTEDALAKALAKAAGKKGIAATIKDVAAKNAIKGIIGAGTTVAGGFLVNKLLNKGKDLFDDGLHALGDVANAVADDAKEVRNGLRDKVIDPVVHDLLKSLGLSEEDIKKFETNLSTGILVVGAVVIVYEVKKVI